MATTTYTEERILPYTPKQLYDVVVDIAAYPSYLPWCVGSRILEETEHEVTADLIIGYKFIRERFRSKVFKQEPALITVDYIEGPLKNLSNRWRFIDNGDGTTTIDFYVAFEFKNPLLKQLVAVFFEEIIKRMVKAFETRAAKLYGEQKLVENPAPETSV